MASPSDIRGRSRIAHEIGVPLRTVTRMRARGEIRVETKSAGRSADWHVTRAEIERVKKLRGG